MLHQEEDGNVLLQCLTSLRSPPTSVASSTSQLFIGHKSGELLSIAPDTATKKVLTREKVSITSLAYTHEILLFGTKKGHIKAHIDGRNVRLGNRHSASIVAMVPYENENGELELITAGTDKKILVWKLVVNATATPRTVSLIFIKALYGATSPIVSADLSDDNALFACTCELSSILRVFKVDRDTQLLFTLPNEEHAVQTIFLTSEVFATISNRNTLYLFSPESTQPFQKLRAKGLVGDDQAVLTLFKRLTPPNEEVPKAVLGFSNGTTVILEFVDHRLHLLHRIRQDSLPNTAILHNSNFYLLAGKEEKHARFIINKKAKNTIRVMVPVSSDGPGLSA
ncbi:hypothetical protein NEDG_00548 [Nematocida displodere]|uniref:Uncharacterized protein n=1 Tax=Nematocida displodere TaxID=1805483 RepID=A0A177EBU4_9MICR|nr:hypothetical protein NEDG_00548 [Nematocida displodere]